MGGEKWEKIDLELENPLFLIQTVMSKLGLFYVSDIFELYYKVYLAQGQSENMFQAVQAVSQFSFE